MFTHVVVHSRLRALARQFRPTAAAVSSYIKRKRAFGGAGVAATRIVCPVAAFRRCAECHGIRTKIVATRRSTRARTLDLHMTPRFFVASVSLSLSLRSRISFFSCLALYFVFFFIIFYWARRNLPFEACIPAACEGATDALKTRCRCRSSAAN